MCFIERPHQALTGDFCAFAVAVAFRLRLDCWIFAFSGMRADLMHDEEIAAVWETIEELGGVITQAQAFNRANNAILMEVVRDIARSQLDPQKYISDMFERVSARADQRPIEREAHPATVEFRDAIEIFFQTAGKNLTK
jgi:hypothetical protein